jgi:cellulose synthase/poly-beta-1,6-N-acetylglucosamine synthase-like glycosyltransferase
MYVIIISAIQTQFLFSGWKRVRHYVDLRPLRDYKRVATSEFSSPVTMLVPAHNEGPSIVSVVKSLLQTSYSNLEVIVINDGSEDETLGVLIREFALVPINHVPRSGLDTKPIREIYHSPLVPNLLVIDKENGGKADALNAGINHAQYPLFCSFDGDTILDPQALARLVWEFQADKDTVATGGIVRVVNGSQVEDGHVVEVTTPKKLLLNIQIVEYLRSFMGGRLALSHQNMLLVISGAFGLFRRDVVTQAGGYDRNSVAEDAELIIRIRKLRAEQGLPCRITFFPDPICWTEAPNSMNALARQRARWHRGLGAMLISYRHMLLNPKYGKTGMITLPYYWLFEFLEPIFTVLGLAVAIFAFAFGLVNPLIFALIFFFSFIYGFFLSMVVILIEERAFRRYPSWHDLRRMAIAVFFENFGYRQWQAWVRFMAIFRIRRSEQGWNQMTRTGFKG